MQNDENRRWKDPHNNTDDEAGQRQFYNPAKSKPLSRGGNVPDRGKPLRGAQAFQQRNIQPVRPVVGQPGYDRSNAPGPRAKNTRQPAIPRQESVDGPPPKNFKSPSLKNAMHYKRHVPPLADVAREPDFLPAVTLPTLRNSSDNTPGVKKPKSNIASMLRLQHSSNMHVVDNEPPNFDTAVRHDKFSPPTHGIGGVPEYRYDSSLIDVCKTHSGRHSRVLSVGSEADEKELKSYEPPMRESSSTIKRIEVQAPEEKTTVFVKDERNLHHALQMPMRSSSNYSVAKRLTKKLQGGKTMFSAFDNLEDEIALEEDRQPSMTLIDIEGGNVVHPNTTKIKDGNAPILKNVRQILSRRKKFRKESNPFFRNQIVQIEHQFGSGIVSFFIFIRSVFILNLLLLMLWAPFVVLPTAVVGFDYQPVASAFNFRNVLDGENGLGKSWMFYGNYASTIGNYPLNVVYLCCIFLTYYGTFFIVMSSMAKSIKYQAGSLPGSRYLFATLVLASWDHSIHSREAANNLRKGVANSFQDILSECKVDQLLKERGRSRKAWIYSKRICAWLVTIALIGGGCVGIFYLVTTDLTTLLGYFNYENNHESILTTYGHTLVFTALNLIVPFIVLQLPKIEDYAKGKVELYTSISRVFVLRMANLLALVLSIQNKIKKPEFIGCAGTLMGKELYRIVILDTLVEGVIVTARIIVYAWTRKKVELELPPIILHVVHRQALIWLGTLVCPVMPIVGVVSVAVLFLSNYLRVTITCKPPSKRWSQPRQSQFFTGLLAVTLIMLIVLTTIITSRSDVLIITSSGYNNGTKCGPFQQENIIDSIPTYLAQVKATESIIGNALGIVTSNTVLIPIIFIMIAIIYYQYLRLSFEEEKKLLLTKELSQERIHSRSLVRKMKQGCL